MNFFIQQDIHIQTLNIEGITNSSVLQIGSAGMIKPISTLYNTGHYTGPVSELPAELTEVSQVPLPAPS
ncbi:putative spore germination protein GerPB [Pullulanibacillus camelliae]|uniref:Putative spore germination protein GerPB n=1 Tax=Pullulanibacillus camelliae TaxID=1707096 RepID=A0A8J2YGZ8_9BACL|nr:spore germination protein GerPB [Pullulanibacillus camelliae]GGE39145.1 putative spore germination protein GerPB [Pullulanibacillus camelliae]